MTFGYTRNATTADASRPLTVYLQEPEQAEVVKEIYARYIGGEPSTQIAADLTNRRVAKHGGPVWLDTLVTRIIQNPAYAGFIFPRGNPLEMRRAANLPDPIVSYETWCEANRVRQERRRLAPRQKTAGAVFSGLLVCAECGSPMQCKGSHAKISWHRDFVEVDEDGTSRVVRRAWSAAKYYQCTLAVSSAYRQCGQHSVREDTLLESIYEMVQPIILDRLSAEAAQAARRRDTELAAHADAISKQRLVLIENVAKGLITQADFETVIRPMNEELAAIQDRMRSSATGCAVVGGRAVSSLFWLENHQQLMVVLRKCVSRIHCRDRHPVVIEADVNYISRQTIAGRVVQVEPSSQGTTLPLHLDANGEVMSVNLDRIVEAARALRVEVEASAVEPDTAATA